VSVSFSAVQGNMGLGVASGTFSTEKKEKTGEGEVLATRLGKEKIINLRSC